MYCWEHFSNVCLTTRYISSNVSISFMNVIFFSILFKCSSVSYACMYVNMVLLLVCFKEFCQFNVELESVDSFSYEIILLGTIWEGKTPWKSKGYFLDYSKRDSGNSVSTVHPDSAFLHGQKNRQPNLDHS